jgi:hypothetical protein
MKTDAPNPHCRRDLPRNRKRTRQEKTNSLTRSASRDKQKKVGTRPDETNLTVAARSPPEQETLNERVVLRPKVTFFFYFFTINTIHIYFRN